MLAKQAWLRHMPRLGLNLCQFASLVACQDLKIPGWHPSLVHWARLELGCFKPPELGGKVGSTVTRTALPEA